MKQEIIAYLTAMINSNERKINRCQEFKGGMGESKKYENFKNELSDLLDFIDDIPEETQPITVVLKGKNDGAEIANSLSYLQERITKLIDQNNSLSNRMKECKESKLRILSENHKLKSRVASLEKAVNDMGVSETFLRYEAQEYKEKLEEVLPFLPQGHKDMVNVTLYKWKE